MTKNIILGAVAALVLAPTAALAADLAVKAPPPVAIYDWTGFYIGVAGGGSLGNSDHIDVATGRSDAAGYNIKGGMAGGTLGYNWQVSSFVFGFEGDASWVGEYGSNPDIGPGVFAAAAGHYFNEQATPIPELHQGNLDGNCPGSLRVCGQQPAVLRDRRLCGCGR